MANVRELFETQRRNLRLQHYPATALDPLQQAVETVATLRSKVAAVNADAHLTQEGKAAARKKAATEAADVVKAWQAKRQAGLDADLAAQRAALLPAGERPDQRSVDFMLAVMQRHTSQELSVFYGSASDQERRIMETASASVGRVPTKTASGLVWQPLLNPESVQESIMARAQAEKPAAVDRLRELQEIRAATATLAQHALVEIGEQI